MIKYLYLTSFPSELKHLIHYEVIKVWRWRCKMLLSSLCFVLFSVGWILHYEASWVAVTPYTQDGNSTKASWFGFWSRHGLSHLRIWTHQRACLYPSFFLCQHRKGTMPRFLHRVLVNTEGADVWEAFKAYITQWIMYSCELRNNHASHFPGSYGESEVCVFPPQRSCSPDNYRLHFIQLVDSVTG